MRGKSGTVVITFLLLGCGSPKQMNRKPLNPGQQEDQPPVSIMQPKDQGFFTVGSPLTLNIHSSISTKKDDVVIYRNNQIVENLDIAAEQITAENFFVEGINKISVFVRKDGGEGAIVDLEAWAGTKKLQVTVLDMNDQPLVDAKVRVKLGEDDGVYTSSATDGEGRVVFTAIPARTVVIDVSKAGYLFQTTALAGADKKLTLKAQPIPEPSNIDNNDFTKGLDGWTISDKNAVKILPHQEFGTKVGKLLSTGEDSATDMDLSITTTGQGPQTISRTFVTKPDITQVKVRYKFITTEIPGGYFGSQFNDYFSVNIVSGSGQESAGNSMNGLGLAAFDPTTGATAWYELTIPVDPNGDEVSIMVSVANVADGLYDSQLVIDSVTEQTFSISSLDLYDIDGSSLNYLSYDQHTYFSGKTRIHGSIELKGNPGDRVTSILLEALKGGQVVDSVELVSDARSVLYKEFFAATEAISTPSQRLLFELDPASDDSTEDSQLILRVRATSENGETASKTFGSVKKLVRFKGSKRYGGRDDADGGDDWLQPSVRSLIISEDTLTIGDCSNMNGGQFGIHGSHKGGRDVDGWYPGYNDLDKDTAEDMLTYLNKDNLASKISFVFVSFQRSNDDPFWMAIKDKVLDDGRKARDVIRAAGGHSTHFHWRFK